MNTEKDKDKKPQVHPLDDPTKEDPPPPPPPPPGPGDDDEG